MNICCQVHICNSISINPPSLLSPDILSPFESSFASGNNPIPMVFSIGSGTGCGGSEEMTNVKRGGSSSGTSMSAQSMAARQRRRRISEKTQELGKLIPGAGTKDEHC